MTEQPSLRASPPGARSEVTENSTQKTQPDPGKVATQAEVGGAKIREFPHKAVAKDTRIEHFDPIRALQTRKIFQESPHTTKMIKNL